MAGGQPLEEPSERLAAAFSRAPCGIFAFQGFGEIGGGTAVTTTGAGAVVGVPEIAMGALQVANGVVAIGAGIDRFGSTFGPNTESALEMSIDDESSGGASGTGGGGKGTPLRPEAKYLGSGKHGLTWTEGSAEAKSVGKAQGQWGRQADLDFAGDKASTLKPREGGFFDLPSGSKSVIHRPDGTTVPATRIWVRNNGTGTFHGAPWE